MLNLIKMEEKNQTFIKIVYNQEKGEYLDAHEVSSDSLGCTKLRKLNQENYE